MSSVGSALRRHPWGFAVVAAVLLLVANQLADSTFAKPGSWPSTLADFAPFALAALASTPAILSGGGGIDISIGPSLNLVSVILVGELLPHGLSSAWVAIPIALALGLLVGAISGVLIAYLRYQAVLATLCGLFVLTGIGEALLSSPATATTDWLGDLGNKIGPIPGGLIMIVIPFLIWWGLGRTAYVGTLYAVGSDEVTAYSAGVNVRLVRLIAYSLGGLFAGLAGLALAAATQTGDASQATEYVLPAVAAVAIGGTSLTGGRGSLVGALAGAAIIYLIQTLLDALSVNDNWLQLVYGAVLLFAIVLGSRVADDPDVALQTG